LASALNAQVTVKLAELKEMLIIQLEHRREMENQG
jgi:hypothetical protein